MTNIYCFDTKYDWVVLDLNVNSALYNSLDLNERIEFNNLPDSHTKNDIMLQHKKYNLWLFRSSKEGQSKSYSLCTETEVKSWFLVQILNPPSKIIFGTIKWYHKKFKEFHDS